MGNTGTGMPQAGMGAAGGTIGQGQDMGTSKEYLVEGAKLVCVNGSCITQLKLTDSHHYTSGGKRKANCRDCKACDNIPYFGNCRKNEDTHQCQGFMDLADQWVNTAVTTTKAECVDGEDAITMTSVLLCKKGGIIMPLTSGQGYDGAVNWAAFLDRYQKVVRWAAGKNLLCHVFGKDPINMNTGNFIYEKEDLVIEGSVPLSFKLSYNAMDCGDQGVLGEGWSHNYGVCLRKIVGEDLLAVVLEDGREVPYRLKIGDEYAPVMGDEGALKKTGDGYELERSGITLRFDKDGRLKQQIEQSGRGRTFSYNTKGLLVRVDNGNGGQLNYAYNEEKRLISVWDHTGRNIYLQYQYGKLRWFTNSNGNTYTYKYNENGILDGVVTPRDILGVKNEYDGADRVVKQTLPDGSVVELRYDDKNNRTYLKEQNGNLIIYECDERMRNIRTIYEDGEESFAYNDRNQKVRYTDKNGNVTRYSYDDRGNLTQVMNALGEKTCMAYDKENNLLYIKFQDKGQVKFAYDGQGNLIETVNQLGYSYRADYNEKGKITSILQPDNSFIRFEYDDKGNLTHETGDFGDEISYEYNELNQMVRKVDGNHNETQYSYDSGGNLVELIDAMGNKEILKYNESGRIISVTNFDGTKQDIGYDDCNRPCEYRDSEGEITQYQYDYMGNLEKITYPNGGEASYTYDHLNRLKAYMDVMGAVVKFNYDAVGNLTKKVGPRGEATTFTYNALNQRTSVCEPDGSKTFYEYNTQGRIAKITDSSGKYLLYEYDLCGRTTKYVDVFGNTTTYAYNFMDNVIEDIDGAGRKTSYSYYPGGLMKKLVYPDGTWEQYIYDGNKNLVKKEDQAGYIIQYIYDKLDRITKIASNKDQEIELSYNAADQITSKTDANGNTTYYEYSPNGKLVCVTDVLGNKTMYKYDCMGNLSTIFMPENEKEESLGIEEAMKVNQVNHSLHVTTFERDLQGRVKAVTDALGNMETYEYDQVGNIIKKCDGDGYETQYTYDLHNHLCGITYGDQRTANFIYNSLHHLEEIRDWSGTTRIKSDEYGRIQDITDYRGKKISYEFGQMGEKRAIIYPDGSRVDYSYDNCLRLSGVRYNNQRVKFHYNVDGYLCQKDYADNLVSKYSYDESGFLTALSHENEGNVIDRYEYSYDRMGNKICTRKYRRNLTEDSGDFFYDYDDASRLIKVRSKDASLREYTYDLFGNRLSKQVVGNSPVTYTYNALNQLVSEKGSTDKHYSYDKRGNLHRVVENGEEDKRYKFGALDRIEEVSEKSGAYSLYGYNGIGMRVSCEHSPRKDIQPQTCWYTRDLTVVERGLLEQEWGNENKNYIWGNDLIGLEDGKTSQFFFLDDIESPIRLMYPNGNISESYSYDEYGCFHKNEYQKQSFGYTGYLKNDIFDIVHAFAREYKPEWGRFISEDKLKGNIYMPYTQNCYNYCFNNPINYVDLNGEWPKFVNKACNWVKKHKKAIVHGAVVVGVAAVTAVVVVAAAPVEITAAATAGIMAVGAGIGMAADAAVQVHELHTGQKEKFNVPELLINGMTGAGAAVTGPMGASVMGVTNYVGTELVNDREPSAAGVVVSGGLGFLGGAIASKAWKYTTKIALSRGETQVCRGISYIGGKYMGQYSFNPFTKAVFSKAYSRFLSTGVIKSFIVTNPWISMLLTDDTNEGMNGCTAAQ